MSNLVSVIVSLVVGVLGSLIWLLVLFCIKPRLTVEVRGRRLRGQPVPGVAFVVTNNSLASAVQLQARLWRVSPDDGYPTRSPVALRNGELFRLNGSWASRRRSREQRDNRTGDNRFRFLTDPAELLLHEQLGDNDRLVFQVWAEHSFTNFGRVVTKVITKAELPQRISPPAEPGPA
jgi:hypothetical protein